MAFFLFPHNIKRETAMPRKETTRHNMNNELNIGFLSVSAVTAGGLLPVEGALITVSIADDDNTYVYRVVLTDRSGKTPKIPIPTPSAALSLSPSEEKPYTSVIIEGEKEGFYNTAHIEAPIFPENVTLQQLNFIPIKERANIQNSETVYYGDNTDAGERAGDL